MNGDGVIDYSHVYDTRPVLLDENDSDDLELAQSVDLSVPPMSGAESGLCGASAATSQNPASINEITYQGLGAVAYQKDASGIWICPEDTFGNVSFTVTFNPDGTIAYHDCKIEGVAMTCDLEFAPTTTENFYEGSNLEAEGISLTFPKKDLSEVVWTLQEANSATDGAPIYCTFTLPRVNP